ncbi:putative MnhB-related membrane protein [Streptacidiphilus sp. MAP12-33]|uniref:hypothetical protein n=1 Tax=Streptacidiphilus sp. MAP12-33 TaxID=3156266 RepID=UPI0035116A70
MLIALMFGFAVLGLGVGGYQAFRRRWFEAARVVVGCATAVAGYAAMQLHAPSIAVAATRVGVAATVAYVSYVIQARRAQRR